MDDVLLIDKMKCDQLSAVFPIKEWESGKFDYVGSFIEILEDTGMPTTSRLRSSRNTTTCLCGALSWMANHRFFATGSSTVAHDDHLYLLAWCGRSRHALRHLPSFWREPHGLAHLVRARDVAAAGLAVATLRLDLHL